MWGSILDLKNHDCINSDIDMLVLVSNLKPFYLKTKKIQFGVPVSRIKKDFLWFDIFYIDESYLIKALENGHWTLFRAINEGIRIIDHHILKNLKKNIKNFEPFTINTPNDWFNQARNLLQKSQDIYDKEYFEHSVILARDAVQSALYAFVYKSLGKPPSPKSFISDIKNSNNSYNFLDIFLKIHKVKNISKNDATIIQIQCFDIIEQIQKLFKGDLK